MGQSGQNSIGQPAQDVTSERSNAVDARTEALRVSLHIFADRCDVDASIVIPSRV